MARCGTKKIKPFVGTNIYAMLMQVPLAITEKRSITSFMHHFILIKLLIAKNSSSCSRNQGQWSFNYTRNAGTEKIRRKRPRGREMIVQAELYTLGLRPIQVFMPCQLPWQPTPKFTILISGFNYIYSWIKP